MKTTRTSLSAAVLLMALALAGCSVNTAASGGDIDAAVKKDAQAVVADFTKVPESRSPDRLSAKAPSGKSVVAITCPLPTCARVTDEFVKAVDNLSWSTRVLVAEFTPESYVGAFESAIQLDPDYIYYIATQPNNVIAGVLDKAKAAGIPVIVNSPAPDTEIGGSSPIVAAVSGKAYTAQYAKLMADLIISDADSLGSVTFMYDPAAPSYVYAYGVFKARIEKAGGKVVPFEINQGDAGTTLLSQIVSYLQRNPDTEYLAVAHDNLIIGLPDSIAAAGLTAPKIVGVDPGEDNLGYVKAGTEFGTVQPDTLGAQWDVADILARLSVGDSLDADLPGGAMIGIKANVDDMKLRTFKGIPDNYLKAWLLK